MTRRRDARRERFLRVVMRVYPRRVRARFGDDLIRTQLAELDAGAPTSRLRRGLRVARVVVQHLMHGLAARWSSRGGLGLVVSDVGLPWYRRLSSFHDWRAAWRAARGAPLTSVVIVASLTLGIGATSAVYSVVQAVVLRPLPYADPDELVMVSSHVPSQGRVSGPVSQADFLDLQQRTRTLAALEAFQATIVPSSMTIDEATVSAQRVVVTPGLFELLGRPAALGRTFDASADRDQTVISHGFWQRAFGGDPGVVGRTIGNGTLVLTVVGVMPADFAFPYPSMLLGPVSFTADTTVDFWVPVAIAGSASRAARNLGLVGRLGGGQGLDQVRAELTMTAADLAAQYPDTNAGVGAMAEDLHTRAVGDAGPVLLLMFAGVALVLLVACVNAAGLLVARGWSRRHELALRVALGAGHGRVVRQVLHESLLLALAGGGLGLLLLTPVTSILVSMAPAEVPRLDEVALDLRVVTFAGIAAVLTGVLMGLVPALAAARPVVLPLLRDSGRSATSGPGRHRARSVLIVVEVALVVMVVVATGLIVRSLVQVLGVDTGFRADRLLTMQIAVPNEFAGSPDQRLVFYDRFFETLLGVPGVIHAGGTTRLPLGGADSTTAIAREGSATTEGQWPVVDLRRAVGDYFTTMDMPIHRGRAFDERDHADSPPVVVINQTLAATLFGGSNPIGERVQLGPNAGIPLATVIGVVGDIRHRNLETAPASEVYVTAAQNPPVAPIIVVRTEGDADALGPTIRRAFERDLPDLTIARMQTMTALRNEATAPRRFLTMVVGVFGLVGLVLAVGGVYGLTSLAAVERLREMAVRQALGAQPGLVVRLVIRRSLLVTGTGLVLGLAGTLLVMPAISGLLFQVRPADPLTLAGVTGLLLVSTLVAAAVPALRAARSDPVTLLRA